MNDKAKGYLLGAVAAATYGMNPLFAIPLYGDGMNPDSVLFFRYLLAIPLLGVMLKVRGRSLRLQRAEVAPLVFYGLMIALSSLALFLSYGYMGASIASTLLFVYPIMVAVIMACLFRERLRPVTLLCMTAALAGIGLLYRNGDGSTISLVGTLFVFVSSLSYAIYLVGINRVKSIRNEPTLKITFYVLLFGVVLFVGRLLWTGDVALPRHWYMWGNLLGLAVFPTAISFLCTTAAINKIGSTPTAILGALEPVTAVVFGVAVFHETLSVRQGLGLVLIIAAVTLVVAGGRISLPMTRFRHMFPRLRRKG